MYLRMQKADSRSGSPSAVSVRSLWPGRCCMAALYRQVASSSERLRPLRSIWKKMAALFRITLRKYSSTSRWMVASSKSVLRKVRRRPLSQVLHLFTTITDVAILPLNNTSNGVRINDKKLDDKEGITFDNLRIHLTAMFPIWNKTVSDEPDVN